MKEFRSVARQLEIEMRDLTSLRAYPRNARTHADYQVDQILHSIEEFGFSVPILIDEYDTILSGHGRALAAERVRMSEVPVIVLKNLSEAQKQAFALAENRIALNAGWDDELLRGELEALQEAGFSLDTLGFDQSELDRLLDDVNVEAPAEFEQFDEHINTEHQCPQCGYRWSGSSKARDG